ncbi:hypothetical protein MKX01_012712 [Papaver californicum]|nr:hypothetical protein MKX01_012712 [Papaver californicum]
MDSDEELEDRTLLLVVGAVIENQKGRIYKEPCRNSILTGHQHMQEILHGHPRRCYEQYRMEKFVFLRLSHILRERELLHDSRWITIEEQLAIFLLTIGHNEHNRMLQERFQHSGETISRYFNEVLGAIMELSKELIKAPYFSETPVEILNNTKYYPWFKVHR